MKKIKALMPEAYDFNGKLPLKPVSYTHLTLPTTPSV